MRVYAITDHFPHLVVSSPDSLACMHDSPDWVYIEGSRRKLRCVFFNLSNNWQYARRVTHAQQLWYDSFDALWDRRATSAQPDTSSDVTIGVFLPLSTLAHWTAPDLQPPSPGLRSLISTRNPARQLTFHRFEISKQGHPRCRSRCAAF